MVAKGACAGRWLYLLYGGRLLVVEAGQFKARMSEATEALSSAREVVFESEVTPQTPRAGMKAQKKARL